MTEKITKANVLELWASQYHEVTIWLGHLQKKAQSAYYLFRFCKWCKLTPPELLTEKEKKPSANTVEKILDEFCAQPLPGFTNAEQYNTSIAVKSFFKWNYRDLAKASGAVTLEKVKPYNKLTKEGLRKLWNFALNPRDKALMTFVNSTAIAKETLMNLKWSHLEENWEKIEFPCVNIPSQLLKGHGVGKYANVRQTTFLTHEAKRDLLNYKEWLERPQKLNRKLRLDDHMWLETCKPYRPISYDTFGVLIMTLSKNAGVPFSWHDARRWVNTALEQIGISPNWARKIRGRKIKGEESPYSQPAIEQLRAKFKEAVPLLEFTSETASGVEERLKAVEQVTGKLAAREPLTSDDYDKIQRYGIKMFSKTEAAKRKERKEQENCTDGEHCQRVVGEEELASLLSEGWHASLVLPSGKVVVTR